MKKHWFFDLDGTLARTGEDIIAALKGALEVNGYDTAVVDRMFVIGPPLEKIFCEMYPGKTPDDYAKVLVDFKPIYDESDYPNTVVFPGIAETLAELKRRGAEIFIVTNKRHAPTQRIAAKFGWDRVFDGVWSFDSFGVKYAKADLLARLLRERGIAASDAVMVGDMRSDIVAGSANGMTTVGVTWGYGTREDLADADLICDKPSDIINI